MRKFHCLLFVLKRSFICYYIIYMTVPLITFTLDYLGYWLSCQLFEKCWCLAFCKCTLLFCARHEKYVKNNSYKFLFYYSFFACKKMLQQIVYCCQATNITPRSYLYHHIHYTNSETWWKHFVPKQIVNIFRFVSNLRFPFILQNQ